MKSLLDQLRRSERATDMHPGHGASIFKSSFGRIVRFNRSASTSFEHPWLASLAGAQSAEFLPGLVNNVQATIQGVPLDGGKKQKVPTLRWRELKLDGDGIGYFCVEVTCVGVDEKGKSLEKGKTPWSILKAEMVQVADPNTDDGKPDGIFHMGDGGAKPLSDNRARWPIAMIADRGRGQLDLFQIVHFNLTHRVAFKKDGKNPARHFFF